jgi:hypothetical protein
MVGMYSDNEEQAEGDVDYNNMSQLKQRYLNRKRHGSDETNNGRDDKSDISSFHGNTALNYVGDQVPLKLGEMLVHLFV